MTRCIIAALLLAGCSDDQQVPEIPKTVEFAPTSQMLDNTWVVQMTDDALRTPYQENQGWVTLVLNRDYLSAIRHFGPSGGMATARAHADLASQYQQAALLVANSLIETYDETPVETDPLGIAHPLAVAFTIAGHRDKANNEYAQYTDCPDPPLVWREPWTNWLAEANSSWPPDLSGLPLQFTEPLPGMRHTPFSLPHYTLPLNSAPGEVEMGDPGALVAAAQWHYEAATIAAEDKVVVDTYMGRYRLPMQSPTPKTSPLPIEMLFGSDYLVPEDGPFMAAVTGNEGLAAIDSFAAQSLLAHLAQASRIDGTIDSRKAQDNVEKLRLDIIETTKQKSAGRVQGAQKLFANIARAGAFRQLAIIAELEGNREESGTLQVAARDAGVRTSETSPVGMLAYAAWDAQNRFTMRALDTVHQQALVDPTIDTARYAVEVLALRENRMRNKEDPR
ncbi:MAG: hypothetical protein HN348_08075 [Proteobacteria bacterium]|nr:hypothetical protein [Pseudomonadota bacterium]